MLTIARRFQKTTEILAELQFIFDPASQFECVENIQLWKDQLSRKVSKSTSARWFLDEMQYDVAKTFLCILIVDINHLRPPILDSE